MFRNIIKKFFSDEFWIKERVLLIKSEKSILDSKKEDIKNFSSKQVPENYVLLILDEVDEFYLHNVHNISLKVLEFDNRKYINSFILLNIPKEFDCYADGENEKIIIRKIEEDLICIIAIDKEGKEDKLYIYKGKIEFRS